MPNKSKDVLLWEFMDMLFSSHDKWNGDNTILSRIIHWIETQNELLNLRLEYKHDNQGNLYIFKPATSGCEQFPSILLHAHYDQYSEEFQKNLPYPHSCIELDSNHEWITILGSPFYDDSITGLIIISNLLFQENSNVHHGPIEVLITKKQDEQFQGVLTLDSQYFDLKSEVCLNFDGVDLATIIYGTGGCREYVLYRNFRKSTDINLNLKYLKLEVGNLKGGDMGSEIHFLRGNAIKIVARLLNPFIEKYNLHIADWKGGNYYRFIPRDSVIIFALPQKEWKNLESALILEQKKVLKKYKKYTEYGQNLEPDIYVKWKECQPQAIFSHKDSEKIIYMANVIPHGLVNSSNFENEEEKVCNNFAKVQNKNQNIEFHLRARGANSYEFDYFEQQLNDIANLGNWIVQKTYEIPIWRPQKKSSFLKYVQRQYEHIIYQPVRIIKTFWTLEMGILEQKFPKLSCVSVGPTEVGVYPAPYKIRISHIQALYRLTTRILENLENLFL